MYGYIWCDDIQGEVGHSCLHGEGPHLIKVAVIRKYTKKEAYGKLLEQAGPKPELTRRQ